MRKIRLACIIVWSIVCIGMLTILIGDAIQFEKSPELYPMGWEEGGWAYASSFHYRLSNGLFSCWSLLGLLPLLLYKRKSAIYFLVAHVSLSLFSLL